jgi:hypothetical protein
MCQYMSGTECANPKEVIMKRFTSAIITGFAVLVAFSVGSLLADGINALDRADRPSPASSPTGQAPWEYVALCEDVPDGMGPCVAYERPNGSLRLYYVAAGRKYPDGRQTIAACPTEGGGPGPCVWVPSVMGNDRGDSGAYVYR